MSSRIMATGLIESHPIAGLEPIDVLNLARRHTMQSAVLGKDLDKLWPLIGDGSSDSAIISSARGCVPRWGW